MNDSEDVRIECGPNMDEGIIKTAERLKMVSKFPSLTVDMSGPGAGFVADDIRRIIAERDQYKASARRWERAAENANDTVKLMVVIVVTVALMAIFK